MDSSPKNQEPQFEDAATKRILEEQDARMAELMKGIKERTTPPPLKNSETEPEEVINLDEDGKGVGEMQMEPQIIPKTLQEQIDANEKSQEVKNKSLADTQEIVIPAQESRFKVGDKIKRIIDDKLVEHTISSVDDRNGKKTYLLKDIPDPSKMGVDYTRVNEEDLAGAEITNNEEESIVIGSETPELDVPEIREKELGQEESEAIGEKIEEWDNVGREHIDEIKKSRSERFKDTAIEATKSALGSKAVQWYLGLNKFQRLALTTVLATGVGYLAGTVGAIGVASYATQRLARGAISLGTSGFVNKIAYKKAGQELEGREKNTKQDIENAEGTPEEKEAAMKAHEDYFNKEKRKIALKKAGLTIAAGAGAGLLTGLAEHLSIGGSSILESKPNIHTKVGESLDANKPRVATTADYLQDEPKITERPNFFENSIGIPKPVVPVPEAPNLFVDSSMTKVKLELGDSRWKALSDVLEKSERFKHLTEAQQNNAVANFNNEVMKNPTLYGIHENGDVFVGDKLDFSKLFEDNKLVDSVFSKAAHLSGTQSAEILERTYKIRDYVGQHPDVGITPDKINEILATEPGEPLVSAGSALEHMDKVQDQIYNAPNFDSIAPKAHDFQETINSLRERALELQHKSVLDAHDNQELLDINKKIDGLEDEMLKTLHGVQDHIPVVPEPPHVDSPTSPESLPHPIAEVPEHNAVGEHIRSMATDTKLNQAIDQSFAAGLDKIYGKTSMFGGKTPGMISKDWLFISKQPMKKLLYYYTEDENKSGLPLEVVKQLSKSDKHHALATEIAGLMNQTKGQIQPKETENTADFLKRLIAGAMDKSNLAKAA